MLHKSEKGSQSIQIMVAMVLIVIVVFAFSSYLSWMRQSERNSMNRLNAHLLAQETLEWLLADGFPTLICPTPPLNSWITDLMDPRLDFEENLVQRSVFVRATRPKRKYQKILRTFDTSEILTVGLDMTPNMFPPKGVDPVIEVDVAIEFHPDGNEASRQTVQLMGLSALGSHLSPEEAASSFSLYLKSCGKT